MSLKNLFFLANEGSGDLTSPLLGDKLKLPANMYLAASIIAGVIITLIGGLIFLRLPLEIMPKFLLFDAPIFFYLLIGIVIFIFSVSGRIFCKKEELRIIIILSAGIAIFSILLIILLSLILGSSDQDNNIANAIGFSFKIIVAIPPVLFIIGGIKGYATQNSNMALVGSLGGFIGGILGIIVISIIDAGSILSLFFIAAFFWGGIIFAEEYLTSIVTKQLNRN